MCLHVGACFSFFQEEEEGGRKNSPCAVLPFQIRRGQRARLLWNMGSSVTEHEHMSTERQGEAGGAELGVGGCLCGGLVTAEGNAMPGAMGLHKHGCG